MKLLVTGGLGFIGSNFISNILKKYENYEIINVDNESIGSNHNNISNLKNSQNYFFVKGSITDKKLMSKLINDCDVVINFAAESHVDRSISNPKPFIDSNILGVFNKVSKEKFIKEDKVNICYSDQDILVKDARGYLKNLHLAQILHFADIKSHEKVLHIGGLTGYLSVLISKLCNEIYITDNDEECVKKITNNLKDNDIKNGYVFKQNFRDGLENTAPYNLIVIDCPQYELNLDLLNQLHDGGKIIYIEKINEELSKGYRITKMNDNYAKDFLFDVFSNFYLVKKEEVFSF